MKRIPLLNTCLLIVCMILISLNLQRTKDASAPPQSSRPTTQSVSTIVESLSQLEKKVESLTRNHGQSPELSELDSKLNHLIAALQNNPDSLDDVPTFPAPAFPVPASLASLLDQAKQPGMLEGATIERVEKLREDLVSEINPLSPASRDLIVREIAQANLVLEILELRASPDEDPDDALVSIATIEALLEGDFDGLADEYREYLDDRSAKSAGILIAQLRAFSSRLSSASNPLNIPEEDISRAVLYSMVAAGALDDYDDEPALWIPGLASNSVAWMEESRALRASLGEFLPGTNWMLAAGELSQQGVSLLNRCRTLQQQTLGDAIRKELDTLENLNKKAQDDAWKKYQLQSLDTIDFALSLAGGEAKDRWEDWLSAARGGDSKKMKEHCMKRSLATFPNFRAQVNKLCSDVDLSDAGKARNLSDANAKRISDCLHRLWGWYKTKELMEWLNRDLLVVSLMPIETAQLDAPIARLHSKAFEAAWAHLEATDHQRRVAGASANVKKQSIEIPSEPWTP